MNEIQQKYFDNIIAKPNQYLYMHHAISISVSFAQNLFFGKVIKVGKDPANNKFVVCVQLNKNECIRYCNLDGTNVNSNDMLSEGDEIGRCQELGIEYCTGSRGDSLSPVRIGTRTYFKQDASILLSDAYIPNSTYAISIHSEIPPYEKLDSAQSLEFGNNRGNENVEF